MTKSIRYNEIYEIVKEILVQTLGIDEKKISEKANFIDDLGADSLDSVEIIMAVEERFKISCPDEDAAKIKTVEELVNYIEEKE